MSWCVLGEKFQLVIKPHQLQSWEEQSHWTLKEEGCRVYDLSPPLEALLVTLSLDVERSPSLQVGWGGRRTLPALGAELCLDLAMESALYASFI